MVAEHGYHCQHWDIQTAFLNGPIDTEIYMEQPHGFSKDKGLVCLLQRSIYGLRQSARIWFHCLKEALESRGLKPLLADPCVFLKPGSSRSEDPNAWVIIFAYVDDMGAVSPSQRAIDALKKSLESQFSIKDLGPLTFFLGIQVIRGNGCLHLSQATYVERILARFGMENCAPISTPMEPKLKLEKNAAEEDPELRKKIQSLIGAVLYLSRMTRPNISYAVAAL
jgi:hypothetical protein